MADLNEHVAYLSQEIGPRPAGTEEEQRAALYISECLSKETGFTTAIEDFQCNPDSSIPRGLTFGVAFLVTLLATIFPVVVIPAIVVDALCALLWGTEVFNKPVLSRFLNRGVSQNVVSKYVPAKSANHSTRRRKVIIVANYDSGKVRPDVNNLTISLMPGLHWAEFAMLVVMPVLLLIRMLVDAQDTTLIIFNVFLGITMAVAALPVLSFIIEKVSSYSEGANCNASGIAVMIDVAARVAAARDLPDAQDPYIHGEAAARSAGLVPEGAALVYETGMTGDDLGVSLDSAAERLAAAKAAVAALSGKPVSPTPVVESAPAPAVPAEVAPVAADPDETIAVDMAALAIPDADLPAAVAADAAALAVEMPLPEPEPEKPALPDWFVKAQEQAKKPRVEKPVQRSRYAEAMDKAAEAAAARAEAQKTADEELSERMRTMRQSVQAASEAAGATPTGIIPNAIEAAASSTGLVEGPAPRPAVAAAAAGQEGAPGAAVAPTLPADAPAGLASVPLVIPTDDPDITFREGQRPLTGSIPAIADDEALGKELEERVAVAGGEPVTAAASADAAAATASATPIAAGAAAAAVVKTPVKRKKRAISLPNIGISQELPRISTGDHQQAAPLSEERPVSDGRVHDISAVIPTAAVTAAAEPEANAAETALRDALPSLSGVEPGLSGSINLAGAFSSMGATGAAAPIGDEMLQEVPEEDLYIDDVDDSAYVEQITETGAMAGPGYVEMPKSRFGRLFGRKRRKEYADEVTPQEWLDVEDDFEAQEVGAARGSWESFREDSEYEQGGPVGASEGDYYDAAFADDEYDDTPRRRRGRHFEGGAFSRRRAESRRGESRRAEEEPLFEGDELPLDEEPRATSPFADVLPENFVFDTAADFQQIEQFHNKRIDMEVWFVALGAELAGNGGMKAFMAAHEAEMKGSIIVEVEALGAGELTLIDKEGTYLPKKAAGRMKRLVKKAGQAVGLSVPSASMTWRDSTSAYVMKHGHQALHVAGMEDKKPAFFAERDDIAENVDNDQVSLNADFVMELLRAI